MCIDTQKYSLKHLWTTLRNFETRLYLQFWIDSIHSNVGQVFINEFMVKEEEFFSIWRSSNCLIYKHNNFVLKSVGSLEFWQIL